MNSTTTTRDNTIEQLANGLWRLDRRGSGLVSLHDSFEQAALASHLLYHQAARLTHGMPTYRPGCARVDQPTPQSDPALFTTAEISAEIKHLMHLNERLGSHPLRTTTYLRLLAIVNCRQSCGVGEEDGCDPNYCHCPCHLGDNS